MGNYLRWTIFAIHLWGRANTYSSWGYCGSRLRPGLFAVRRWKSFFCSQNHAQCSFSLALTSGPPQCRDSYPAHAFRVHPLESIIYFLRGLFVFGLVSGVFIWLFGRELTFFHIFGSRCAWFYIQSGRCQPPSLPYLALFWRFEKYFISPAQHQFHHSKDHGHPNFGYLPRFLG